MIEEMNPSSRKVIFVSKEIMPAGMQPLTQSGHEIVVWKGRGNPTAQELLQASQQADGLLCMLSDKIDKEFINACPRLKVIANHAVGYNNIDISYASQKGIAIGNTPGVLTDATAEFTFTLLLALARAPFVAQKAIERGEWIAWEPTGYLGVGLKGKTLGILGLGRIGAAVAKIASNGFGMNVIHSSRSRKTQATEQVDFETLLSQSDFISVHADLNPSTHHIFNYQAFCRMKRDAFFINTSRGELHHEGDLLRALVEKKIKGAALDVTNPEPMAKDSPLLKMDNVIVAPHIASATFETRNAMSRLAAENVLAGLERKPLPGFVNPEVFE